MLKIKVYLITGPARIVYHSARSFKNIATMFGLMADFRSKIPRTGYQGVVTFYYKNRRLYITPNRGSGYEHDSTV